MKKFLNIILVVCSTMHLFGQQERSIRKGQVSFITSQNIYVKFATTENIQNGDTLFINKENKLFPALIVDQHSSISCICKPISEFQFKLSDEVFAFIRKNDKVQTTENRVVIDSSAVRPEIVPTSKAPSKPVTKSDQLIQGRISVASYSNFSNSSEHNNTRMRYTMMLNIGTVKKSGLSAESYIQYTHNTNELTPSPSSIFNHLKIYNLAVKYKMNKGLNFTLGRSMNAKVSSLGSIDGIQTEYNPGNFFIGGMAGFRPDYIDYGFNSNLFEYGTYIGHHHSTNNGIVQSTLAFFEQNNQGKTDRRFAYFQHDNSLLKDLNLFISGEVDLFKIENGLQMNSLSLTSLYLSLHLRVSSQLSLFGSYDERKNVIYYQTFRNRGDSIFDAATRQGTRLRINYRPGKIVSIGLNAGYQFRNKDISSTENLSGSVSFNNIPGINSTATITANLLRAGYLNGKMGGLTLNKDFYTGKINLGIGYEYVNYNFLKGSPDLMEHIAKLNFLWRITRKLSFALDCEKTFEKPVNYTRIFANLIKRF